MPPAISLASAAERKVCSHQLSSTSQHAYTLRWSKAMIPVTQTITGEQGNCFTACLASILELPIRAVPNFAKLTNSDEEFFAMVDEWLATRGLKYSTIPIYNRAVP